MTAPVNSNQPILLADVGQVFADQPLCVRIDPAKVSGCVQPPASKSQCHRAIICASLAKGTSSIQGLSLSKDIEATIRCMEALGAQIVLEGRNASISGTVPSPETASSPQPIVLDAGESGSTLRFLIPVAAAFGRPVRFLGKPSLLSRPMGIYADLFAAQSLPFDQSGQAITFQGPLQSGLFEIPGSISSQFISGLLLAAPLAGMSTGESSGQGSEIAVLPPYQSRSYTSMTTECMARFGVHVEEPTDHGYIVSGGQQYQPADLMMEADASQMAFFAVLAYLSGSIRLQGLNPQSAQGDAVILSILEQCGAVLEWQDGILQVSASPDGLRRPFTADLADCPDLGPILCVLASYLEGTSRILHAGRLRFKECDRIAAMEEELRRWGVSIESDDDSITITGKRNWKADHLVQCTGHNDHRIVMAMTVFGLCAQSPSVICGAQAVTKSYPDFFRDIQQLSADDSSACRKEPA